MPDKHTILSSRFNSLLFERFSAGEKEQNAGLDTFAIDGVEVSKDEWMQRQDEAIEADMEALRSKK